MIIFFTVFFIGLTTSIFLGLLAAPWWYNKTSVGVGDRFFMTKKEKPELYSIWMVPSFLMFYESFKNESKGKMFFGKLDTALDDLRKYPSESEFFMITHSKVLAWLENNDQLIVSEPEYINKRFLALRTFMILNKTGPLTERVPFYRVEFKFK